MHTVASASQVAIAAPVVPQLKPKIKIGSSIIFVISPIPLMEKGILLRPAALNIPVKAADKKTNGKAVAIIRAQRKFLVGKF